MDKNTDKRGRRGKRRVDRRTGSNARRESLLLIWAKISVDFDRKVGIAEISPRWVRRNGRIDAIGSAILSSLVIAS